MPETQHPQATPFPRHEARAARGQEKDHLLRAHQITRKLRGEGDWYITNRPTRDTRADTPQQLPTRQEHTPRVRYPKQKLRVLHSCPRRLYRLETPQQTWKVHRRGLRRVERAPQAPTTLSRALATTIDQTLRRRRHKSMETGVKAFTKQRAVHRESKQTKPPFTSQYQQNSTALQGTAPRLSM